MQEEDHALGGATLGSLRFSFEPLQLPLLEYTKELTTRPTFTQVGIYLAKPDIHMELKHFPWEVLSVCPAAQHRNDGHEPQRTWV